MKRVLSTILCLCMLLGTISLTGCAAVQHSESQRSVVDMSGKTVSLPDSVENYCIM